MSSPKEYVIALKNSLTKYIQEKEGLEQQEMTRPRGGSFGGFLNSFNVFQKAPDHKAAVVSRRCNIAHAEYLLNIVTQLLTRATLSYDDLAYLNYEIQRQLKDAGLNPIDSYYREILEPRKDLSSKITKPYEINVQNIKGFPVADVIALWPYFLYSRDVEKNTTIDYSIENFFTFANGSDEEFDGDIHHFFSSIYSLLNFSSGGLRRNQNLMENKVNHYQMQAYQKGYLLGESIALVTCKINNVVQTGNEMTVLSPIMNNGKPEPAIEKWCNPIVDKVLSI